MTTGRDEQHPKDVGPGERLTEELSAYIDGALESTRADELRRLIDADAGVRAEYESLRATIGLLHDLAPVRAPAELLSGVRAKLPRGRRLTLPTWINAKVLGLASVAAAAVVVGISLKSEQGREFETTAEAPEAPEYTDAHFADSGAGDANRPKETAGGDGFINDFAERAKDSSVRSETRSKRAQAEQESSFEQPEAEGLGKTAADMEEQLTERGARPGRSVPNQKAVPDQKSALKKERKRGQLGAGRGESAPGKKVAADEVIFGTSLDTLKDADKPGAMADDIVKKAADFAARFVATRKFSNAGARVSYLERVAAMSSEEVRNHMVALEAASPAVRKLGDKPAAGIAGAGPAPAATNGKRAAGGKSAEGLDAPETAGALVVADAREARAVQTVLSRLFETTVEAPQRVRDAIEEPTFASAKSSEPPLEFVHVNVRASRADLSRFLKWAGSLGLTSTPKAAALVHTKALDGDQGAGAAAPAAPGAKRQDAPESAGVAGATAGEKAGGNAKNGALPMLTVTLVYPVAAAK